MFNGEDITGTTILPNMVLIEYEKQVNRNTLVICSDTLPLSQLITKDIANLVSSNPKVGEFLADDLPLSPYGNPPFTFFTPYLEQSKQARFLLPNEIRGFKLNNQISVLNYAVNKIALDNLLIQKSTKQGEIGAFFLLVYNLYEESSGREGAYGIIGYDLFSSESSERYSLLPEIKSVVAKYDSGFSFFNEKPEYIPSGLVKIFDILEFEISQTRYTTLKPKKTLLC